MLSDFQSELKKRLKNKKLLKQSVWSLAIQEMKNNFPNIEIQGYVKNQIVFVNISPNPAKTQIFLQKNSLITKINNKLAKLDKGQKIKDIRIV